MASRASRVVQDVLAMSQTIDLTRTTFFAYIFPPFVCQYLMGVLVQLEGTRAYRLAFFPVLLCFAWRATLVDMSGGDPTKVQANTMLVTQMCSMATRSAVWAFTHVRYRRLSPVMARSNPDSVYTACWNTWDLLINPRGIGWNWPRGLVVPKPAFETDSRRAFVLSLTAGFAFHVLAFDACVQTLRVLSPNTFGSLNGGPLFDHAFPLVLELARAVLVAFLAAAAAYFGLQYTYKFLAIVCVLSFHQHPSQWPPLFDAPWLSTSLTELWGRRWHQMMRDMLLTLGVQPFEWALGRSGGLLGAFFVSGVFHDIELGRGGYTGTVVGFWVMNGVGVALERVWKKTTGKRVGGVWGWTWMVGWLIIWGIPMVDVYAKVGRFASWSVVGGFEPSLALVGFVRKCISASN
ncbi:hypothetical protein OG21DRAFT_1441204 [Imleria badia]|nr:hypothetical protein OG21DRAFT_1441204 [Imleria badia]